MLGVLAASLLTFLGCGKSGQPTTPTPGEMPRIDATQFRPAFATAPPEIKTVVDKVMRSIGGSLYTDALAGLEQLANTPTLTEPQKKAVTNLTDQVNRKMAAIASRTGQ
jgi:hypothetical protein